MAAKSRMEKYRKEIEILISKGASIRSSWKLINSDLPEEGKISYTAFHHFVRRGKVTINIDTYEI